MIIRSLSSCRNFLMTVSLYAFFAVFPAFADADDHHENRRGYPHENNIFSGHKKADKGNEFSGESAAWLFVIANIAAALSLLSRVLIKFAPIGVILKEKIRTWNRFQKKYLMLFHYVLNPLSLLMAFVHFSLSRCGASSLPEWGLALMTVLTIIGISVKFRMIPKNIRKHVYQFHTNPMPVGFVLIILFAGHSLID